MFFDELKKYFVPELKSSLNAKCGSLNSYFPNVSELMRLCFAQ